MSDHQYFVPTNRKMLRKMFRSEILQHRFNRTAIWNIPKRNRLFKKLVGDLSGKPYCVQSPFHISYGINTSIGKNFFANYNCVIMDHAKVIIGDNVFIAPNVTITTVKHPMLGKDRIVKTSTDSFEPNHRADVEIISPINIGNNVWLATGAIICSGVTIGDNSVIGAGSVVTKDIPPNCFACGVPCRVVRIITKDEKLEYDRHLNI